MNTFKYFLLLAVIFQQLTVFAQGGAISTAHSSSIYDSMLDPDGDGFITASGSNFSSGTTELSEFEVPTDAVMGWVEIFDVNEANSDITPSCSNVDIAEDADGGDIGYWTIVDPTPGSPSSSDEYIVYRIRIADNYSGNFGYNFLVSTDGLFGTGLDANAISGNQGFEYEIQFSSGGGKKGISGWDIDGLATNGTITCAQCVALADVQEADAASAGSCTTGVPTFITFALPLSYLGIASDISPIDLFTGLATASSGNNTSILGGGNVKDYGAFDDDQNATLCPGVTGAALFDCLMDEAYSAQQTALPIELISFEAEKKENGNVLTWLTASEKDFSHHELLWSTDGKVFTSIASLEGRGSDYESARYSFSHSNPSLLSYYQLASFDLDGSVSNSKVIAVSRTSAASSLEVYPNPLSDELHVQLNHSADEEFSEYVFRNLYGAVAQQGFLTSSSSTINVNSLPSGTYFLSIVNGNSSTTHTTKVIKH